MNPHPRRFVTILFVALLPLPAAALACRAPRSGGAGAATGALYLDSPAARAGERIFRRENCGRCHALFARPPDTGEVTLPVPAKRRLFPSRVGPDLAALGHSRSDDWHLAHLYAPPILVHASSMPASRHLFTAPQEGGPPTATQDAIDLVAYLQALGRGTRDIWAEFREADPPIPDPPARPPDWLVDRGTELYRRHCASCHGADGDGRGEAATLLDVPPRDFVAARYRFRSTPSGTLPTDADLFRSITLGGGTGTAMPSFHFLPADDRWALVARIKRFSPAFRGDGPRLDRILGDAAARAPDPGRLAEGRRLWIDLGCPACHGEDARGLSRRREAGAGWTDQSGVPVPVSGDLTHPCALRGGASASALARAVLNGVGDTMPAYAGTLEPPALRALLGYLIALRRPAEGGSEGTVTGPGTRNRRSPNRLPER